MGGDNFFICSLVGGFEGRLYKSISVVFVGLEGESVKSRDTRSWVGYVKKSSIGGKQYLDYL